MDNESTSSVRTALKMDASSGSWGKYNRDTRMDSSFSARYAHKCTSSSRLSARACTQPMHRHGTLRSGIVLFILLGLPRAFVINDLEDINR